MSPTKIGPILIIVMSCTGTYCNEVERQTALGAVSGRKLNLLNTIVEEYIGIPYAKPPVGDLRFMPPVPMEPWEGTYNATQTRTGCPQIPIPGIWAGEVTYTEDCLHLNVWTSRPPMNDSEASAQLSPVLAWIHGGGFCLGSAAYDNYTGSILAAKTGFVVVSMNYRLGVLGFMDARFPGAPGNMGLMDQNLALRWIQKNARFFGGDPAKVTLFGESAGAMSINCHLLSPMSEGLFARAVLLSGTMYTIDFYDTPEENFEKAERLAERVGCKEREMNLTTHPEQIISCLRRIPGDEITRAAIAMTEPKAFPFLPTYRNEYLPQEPRLALDNGVFLPVDVIVGVVSDEMSAVFLYPPAYDFLQENLEGLERDNVTSFLEKVIGSLEKTALPEALDHYLARAKDASQGALVRQYLDYFSDRVFNCPTRYFERKHASGGGKVFSYVFNHKYHTPALPSWMGTPHSLELPFLFGFPLVADTNIGDEHHAMSDAFIKILSSFAEQGYPELPGNKTWPEYSERNPVSVVLAPGNYTDIRDYRGAECDQHWRQHFELGAYRNRSTF